MPNIYINQPNLNQEDKGQLLKDFLTANGINVCFTYDADFKSTKVLRDYIEKICELLKIENKWKSRLILITDEVNNNAIEYGSRPGEINSMRIQIQKDGPITYVQVEVEDTGHGSSSKSSAEMEVLRKEKTERGFKDHNSIRGRGLFMIIKSLVDDLYFKDSEKGGLIVGIKKKL